MTAIPARVAGVGRIILTTPRRSEGPLNPAVLVAAEIAGVNALYQVGRRSGHRGYGLRHRVDPQG